MNLERHTNERELRVVGMSRSGNHAVIGWVLAQARGRTCFLNCAEPRTNPFVSARPLTDPGPAHRASYEIDLTAERQGRLSRKDWLVHSYEDTFLGPLGDPRHEARHDEWLGRSRRRIDLLLLRDPYNLFASRLESAIGVEPGVGIRIWCQHAREFLGLRRHLGNERVPVSYNAWATSRDYRRRVAERLGLEFDDRAATDVSDCGGGSSFDGTRRDGAADEMAVLDRWRAYADDPSYRAIFAAEVHELAERAFGPLEPAAALGRGRAVAA